MIAVKHQVSNHCGKKMKL